jgi:hypothetical protein
LLQSVHDAITCAQSQVKTNEDLKEAIQYSVAHPDTCVTPTPDPGSPLLFCAVCLSRSTLRHSFCSQVDHNVECSLCVHVLTACCCARQAENWFELCFGLEPALVNFVQAVLPGSLQ